MAKKRGHKIGATWSAVRKYGGKRRVVIVHKVGKKKYKVHLRSKSGYNRDAKSYNRSQKWERAYRRHKRR